MTQPTIYHNPKCKKSREALERLQELNYEPNIVKYLDNPPSPETLQDVIQKAGLTVHDIIRKEEKQFKEEFKGKELSDKEWLKVLTENPKLIQRPLVVYGDKACLARPKEELEKIF